MRKLLTAATFALGLAALPAVAASPSGMDDSAGTGMEQGKKTTTYDKSAGMAEKDLRQLQITVKSVDQENHKVTFEAAVKPEANITKKGEALKIDQLKEGDQVRASFDPKSGEVVKLEVIQSGMNR